MVKTNITIALLASVFMLMPASAQDRAPHAGAAEEGIVRRLDAMTRQLDLSDEQTAKLKELLTSFTESDDPAALRDAVAALLTPEQRQKLNQQSGEWAIRSRQRRGRMAAHGYRDRTARTPRRTPEQGLGTPLRVLVRTLDLSAEQQSRLKEIYDSHAAAGRKQQAALREALREILTLEQVGTLRGRMGAMHSRMDNVRRRMWGPRRSLERGRRTARADRMGRRGDRRSDLPVRLSAEQREALGAMRREIDEARRAYAEENPDATDAEKRTFGAAQRKRFAEAMGPVLTAEQQLLLMWRTGRIRRSSSLMELSDDQEAKVKETLGTHRNAAEDWAETNLNPTLEARMEHARAQREALQSALKEILTPEQLKKLDRGGMRRDRARQWRSRRIR